MKKIIAMLLALVMVLGLAACASKTEPAQPEETTPAETETPATTEETTPAETETEEPAATEATGSVYYLNFKPEADEAWQKLAATYTEQTGVPVKVVTAASGTYDTTLAAELDKSSAPTPVPVRQPGRHQLLRRLLLSARRHCHHGSDDHRCFQPQG